MGFFGEDSLRMGIKALEDADMAEDGGKSNYRVAEIEVEM